MLRRIVRLPIVCRRAHHERQLLATLLTAGVPQSARGYYLRGMPLGKRTTLCWVLGLPPVQGPDVHSRRPQANAGEGGVHVPGAAGARGPCGRPAAAARSSAAEPPAPPAQRQPPDQQALLPHRRLLLQGINSTPLSTC